MSAEDVMASHGQRYNEDMTAVDVIARVARVIYETDERAKTPKREWASRSDALRADYLANARALHAAGLLTDAPRRTQILMIEAARQALRPIRDRHTPRTDTFGSVECVHCGYLWPCPDAQKCYTTAELEATE